MNERVEGYFAGHMAKEAARGDQLLRFLKMLKRKGPFSAKSLEGGGTWHIPHREPDLEEADNVYKRIKDYTWNADKLSPKDRANTLKAFLPADQAFDRNIVSQNMADRWASMLSRLRGRVRAQSRYIDTQDAGWRMSGEEANKLKDVKKSIANSLMDKSLQLGRQEKPIVKEAGIMDAVRDIVSGKPKPPPRRAESRLYDLAAGAVPGVGHAILGGIRAKGEDSSVLGNALAGGLASLGGSMVGGAGLNLMRVPSVQEALSHARSSKGQKSPISRKGALLALLVRAAVPLATAAGAGRWATRKD